MTESTGTSNPWRAGRACWDAGGLVLAHLAISLANVMACADLGDRFPLTRGWFFGAPLATLRLCGYTLARSKR